MGRSLATYSKIKLQIFAQIFVSSSSQGRYLITELDGQQKSIDFRRRRRRAAPSQKNFVLASNIIRYLTFDNFSHPWLMTSLTTALHRVHYPLSFSHLHSSGFFMSSKKGRYGKILVVDSRHVHPLFLSLSERGSIIWSLLIFLTIKRHLCKASPLHSWYSRQ